MNMNNKTLSKLQFNEIKEQVARYVLGEHTLERLNRLQPATNLQTVTSWQEETKEGRAILDSGQHVPFMGITRIAALFAKVDKGLILSPNELLEFADFIRSGHLITRLFAKNSDLVPLLVQYTTSLPDLSQVEELIYNRVKNGALIDDASRSLHKIRKRNKELEKKIEAKLQKVLGNNNYKEIIQERLIVKKDGHLTVPIKSSFKNRLNGKVITESNHGATVFIEPEAVATLNEQLILSQAEETAEVYQILAEMTGALSEHHSEIDFLIEAETALDLIFARAKYSREIDGISPVVNKDEHIELIQARHPLLPPDAVPLDFSFGNFRGLVITGPNAGGKTIVLKTVGLLTVMTMFGLQIPAKQGTKIAIFDDVFVDIGDAQNLENELSTFSGHIAAIAEILRQTKRNTLILLDELGSGTEPNEGAALAIAVMESMYEMGGMVMATTHYAEIKNFAQQHTDFMTAAMAFDNETLTPLYTLQLGKVGESQALWIAQKMKIDPKIIKRADRYLTDHHYQTARIAFTHLEKKEKSNEQKRQLFKRGDRVLLKTNDTIGLIYSDEEKKQDTVFVYQDNKVAAVLKKRVELISTASTLYPAGYNLDQLFGTYEERKREHDLLRGSKKAQKELDREMRARNERRKKLEK